MGADGMGGRDGRTAHDGAQTAGVNGILQRVERERKHLKGCLPKGKESAKEPNARL